MAFYSFKRTLDRRRKTTLSYYYQQRKMTKCYIAGKVTGLPEAEYRKKFHKAEIAVAILGYEPVNPVELPHNHDKTWESYMREAIKAMMDCDAIYLLPDWEQSTGARIEAALAFHLNIKILFATDELNGIDMSIVFSNVTTIKA